MTGVSLEFRVFTGVFGNLVDTCATAFNYFCGFLWSLFRVPGGSQAAVAGARCAGEDLGLLQGRDSRSLGAVWQKSRIVMSRPSADPRNENDT